MTKAVNLAAIGSNANSGGSLITSSTVQASTSGTTVDFTGIPSWVKRITVMFNGVSLSGTSDMLIQVGSGSVQSTGYISTGNNYNGANATGSSNSTAGFVIRISTAANVFIGHMMLTNISGNIWISSHNGLNSTANANNGGGNVTTSSTLDRVRITTVNGTDTFDAGSINILYE